MVVKPVTNKDNCYNARYYSYWNLFEIPRVVVHAHEKGDLINGVKKEQVQVDANY